MSLPGPLHSLPWGIELIKDFAAPEPSQLSTALTFPSWGKGKRAVLQVSPNPNQLAGHTPDSLTASCQPIPAAVTWSPGFLLEITQELGLPVPSFTFSPTLTPQFPLPSQSWKEPRLLGSQHTLCSNLPVHTPLQEMPRTQGSGIPAASALTPESSIQGWECVCVFWYGRVDVLGSRTPGFLRRAASGWAQGAQMPGFHGHGAQ